MRAKAASEFRGYHGAPQKLKTYKERRDFRSNKNNKYLVLATEKQEKAFKEWNSSIHNGESIETRIERWRKTLKP